MSYTVYLTLSEITYVVHTSAFHFGASLQHNTKYRKMLYKNENAIV